jgi:hypothetical protein
MPRGGKATRAERRQSAGREVLTLSDDWRVWVVENTLRGVARPDLIATLVSHGVPKRVAARELTAIQTSPALVACSRLSTAVDRLEMVAELRRTLAREASNPSVVARRSGVSADELYDRYFAGNEPVVLTDAMDAWPARTRWSFAYFKERFGDVEVEVCAGRESDPKCDRNYEALRRVMKMSEYIDLVLAAGTTNDYYFIANNRNLEREGLSGLFDDVVPKEEYFDLSRREGSVSLWIGPAGTLTPLHHDTSNILFCQVVGKKRVRLISPLETALLKHMEGVYSALDAERDFTEREDLRDVLVKDVVLSPGEALFIPVGWWHHVRALEPSINFSLLNFRRLNRYTWYTPGARG